MFLYLHEGWSYKAFGTIYVLPPQVVPISGLAHGLKWQHNKRKNPQEDTVSET